MTRRNVALGDCHKTREPRLGGEEIIATWIEHTFRYSVADREQFSVVVEQKAEIH
jgi:hypothetical protein